MSVFSLKFLAVVLLFCISVTTTHGREDCNCRCSVPDYGESNVCEWLRNGSPRVDSNAHEINLLKDELSRFKDNFERKMTDDVRTFIETFTTQKTTENSNTNTNEPQDNLLAEIEMLKTKFKEEQDRLEAKIEQTDKNSLSRTDNLLEIVTSVVTRVLQEANEQKSETAIAKQELLGKFNNLEKETSKVKDDFQTRTTEIEKKISNAKEEVFARMNETFISRDLELKTEFFEKVNEIEETSSKQRRELKDRVEQVNNLLRNEMSTQQTRWIQFEEKTDKIEEILKELNPKEISSNISNIRYNVSEIQNDTTVFWDNITRIPAVTNETCNDICRICSRRQPIQTLQTLEEPEHCDSYLPPQEDIPHHGLTVEARKDKIFQVVRDIMIRDKNKPFVSRIHCYGAIISPYWLVAPARCVKRSSGLMEYFFDYGTPSETRYELKPYLFSENQQCPGCFQNDIGLLKTNYSSNESSCLPTLKMRGKMLGRAVFLGYDRLSKRGKLQKVNILRTEQCRQFYPLFNSSMLCTRLDQYALELCNQRRGGLLFKEYGSRTFLVGVVENCGSGDQPILYTAVAPFTNWIYSFTNNLEN